VGPLRCGRGALAGGAGVVTAPRFDGAKTTEMAVFVGRLAAALEGCTG
jgi:hypothetical protein